MGDMEIVTPISEMFAGLVVITGLMLMLMIFSVALARLASQLFE